MDQKGHECRANSQRQKLLGHYAVNTEGLLCDGYRRRVVHPAYKAWEAFVSPGNREVTALIHYSAITRHDYYIQCMQMHCYLGAVQSSKNPKIQNKLG